MAKSKNIKKSLGADSSAPNIPKGVNMENNTITPELDETNQDKIDQKEESNIEQQNIVSVENNQEQEEVKQEPKTIKITSLNKNFKFGIYYLDCGKTREFDMDVFENNKLLSKDFELELKKGNLKIEY